MKKVLIFSTAYLPMIGGAELAVKEITDRLGGDFEFDLICARISKELPKQESLGAVNIYRVGWGWGKIDKFLLLWRGAALASQLHAKQPYDLVWAIMASFGGLAALKFKLKNPAVPYLLTLQEGDSAQHIASRAWWLGPYYKKMFTAANHLTAISRHLKDFASAQGAKKSIEVVPNGVEINKFQLLSVNKQELRSKLGIGSQEKIIITASRLVAKNGVGDLIEAMIHLPADNKLLVLGSGPLENELRLKTGKLKLNDRVLFLGDVPNDKVPHFLAIADVFVRPSLSEGLGNAFLEAMAAGVPIIGTKVGGIIDFLRQGETGYFCEVNAPESIASKINYIFDEDNFEEVKKVKEAARQLMAERYSWNKIAGQIKTIFEKLAI